MICFNCNYCDEFEFIPISDQVGKIQRVTCKKCGGICWLVHSRIDPRSYKNEDIIVDEETKSVTIKEDLGG